jgi:putative ABC transport system permease protein
MKWRDLFFLVRRNLLRMKLRVAMTAIGVLIGTAAIILVVSLGIGLQRANTESMLAYGELTEMRIFSPNRFSEMGGIAPAAQDQPVLDGKTLREFKALRGVVAVSPLVSLYGSSLRFKRLAGGANVIGMDPAEVEHFGFQLESGTARLGQFQAVAGAKLADNLFDPRTGRPAADRPDLQPGPAWSSKTGEDGKLSSGGEAADHRRWPSWGR